MKLKIIIAVCLFQITMFGQNNNTERAGIILYSGLKFPESSDFDKTGFGFWAGLALDVPLGLNWSIEPDFNYWKAQLKNRTIVPGFNYWKTQFINPPREENIHIIGISLLIAHTFKLRDFSLRFAIGPGLGNESNPFGKNAVTIVLFSFEISSIINLSNQISLVPKIRYQTLGALNVHRGNAYNPFLIGVGLQYTFF